MSQPAATPTPQPLGKCSACMFWDDTEPVEPGQGRCHFSPPAFPVQAGTLARWPITRAIDWCGQWVAATQLVAAT